jgi:hypothetical protein
MDLHVFDNVRGKMGRHPENAREIAVKRIHHNQPMNPHIACGAGGGPYIFREFGPV